MKTSKNRNSDTSFWYAVTFSLISIVSLLSLIVVNTFADTTNQSVSVLNDPPVISNLTYGVSATSDVSLLNIVNLGDGTSAEGSRFTSVITATVSDSNGCADIDNVTSNYGLKLYRRKLAEGTSDGVTCTDTNGADCYIADTGSLSLGSCVSSTDYEIEWPVTTYYFIDSTDAGGYTLTDWGARLQVTDDASAVVTSTDVFEVSTILALDVDAITDYGVLDVGATSTSAEVTVKNTGNVSEDFTVGYNSPLQCTRGSFSGENIKLTRERNFDSFYATAMGSRSAETIVNASIPKATTMADSSTNPFYSFIVVPTDVAVRGACSNTVTYTAVTDRGDGI